MHEKFARIGQAIDAATEGMTEEALTYHREGKWAAAQILEHLAMAFGSTAKVFEKCVEAERPLGDRPKLKQRAQNLLVLELGYFPKGRTAPKQVTPQGQMGGMEALALVRANLTTMDKALAACEEKFGGGGCIANHPVLGPLTVKQWPKFHLVHTRHHMKQIVALREAQK